MARSYTAVVGQPKEVELGVEESDSEEADTPKQRPPPEEPATRAVIVWGVVLYGLCSSTLLVINKVALAAVDDASFLLAVQFISSSVFVRGLRTAKPELEIELLTWSKVKPFFLACLVFFICLLSNTKALVSVNVETVIVVRSCSPILVMIVERLTLGRDLPNAQGLASLVAIFGGAVLYVVAGSGFVIEAYFWLGVYSVSIVTEMVWVKYIVDNVPMTTWSRVYYNNTLSIPLALLGAMITGDGQFLSANWTFAALVVWVMSCVVGVAISFAGFNLRKLISATSFTVVGVVCKLITVLINDIIWNKHSGAIEHVGLMICIGAGFAYERSKAK